MMTPIPEGCEKIVEILRRDVPRPKDEPQKYRGIWGWVRQNSMDEQACACPIGLHPQAPCLRPIGTDFRFSENNIGEFRHLIPLVTVFGAWFDRQPFEDWREVVNAIWGEQA